ncbi:alpha/beta hydrolase [Bordetella bronchialis]|uniref:Lipase n=1 Tax=Bordetella bronchialis TaxID=463025 RepID=A0ABN4R416_9BORD|nr:alpha/beta hydrolase [Bordetella bronchialis]ANN67937.1 lipase [Bordetella bronchialis]
MTGTDAYRIRDFVPDFEEIAAECAERSRALSSRAILKPDIPYGARKRETLDLIFPDRPRSGAPLHVLVHGGYWRSGEKANFRLAAAPVIAAGGIAAVVEYDLMPGERLPLLVDQVRRAVRWLHAHARDFGADPARLTASGHSAGAHLATYLAATGPDESAIAPLPALQGMLLVSGIYDLSGIPDSFLRDEARMTQAEARAWSPLDAVQHPGPERIIAYGMDETPPFLLQAAALHAKLRDSGHSATLLPAPGLNHMNIVLDLADPERPLGQRLSALVASSRTGRAGTRV